MTRRLSRNNDHSAAGHIVAQIPGRFLFESNRVIDVDLVSRAVNVNLLAVRGQTEAEAGPAGNFAGARQLVVVRSIAQNSQRLLPWCRELITVNASFCRALLADCAMPAAKGRWA